MMIRWRCRCAVSVELEPEDTHELGFVRKSVAVVDVEAADWDRQFGAGSGRARRLVRLDDRRSLTEMPSYQE